MTHTPLAVQVDRHDIIVTQPGTPLQVTYRREFGSRMLVADEILEPKAGADLDYQFIAQAWRAAFDKAKSLGWL